MSNNDNNNRNRHSGSDNNGQSVSDVHGGEFRNGRKSAVKNNNAQGDLIPNEYISRLEDEIEKEQK
ncbi:hypothetical protein [Paenibacillus nasutitermitis]|uniref:Uncharacterized protein n=1 Tax=Paenibacillus nasutitermitis TaxID=1652958 RepID=A0A916YYF1_9BACL|nr:hypothetical protein [Paenibacillus nasutitermitis]GGD66974.1 hypothetical protein GCM10010911_25930 [Paenibacillus nasutitermitis]